MKKWVLKAVVQKGISFLPYRHRINYLFQKYITRGVQLSDEYFSDRRMHLDKHLAFWQEWGPKKPMRVLELGTGWYPVIPLGYFLAGAERIHTADISPLLTLENLQTTVRRYVDHKIAVNHSSFLEERWERLEALAKNPPATLEEYLQELQIEYLVGDARTLSLENETITLISSNNTFEHVHPPILKGLLVEFDRVLDTDGIMSHFIDLSDHFAHLDQQITIYNFLRFSEKAWSNIDNDIQPQNRWRMWQYRALYTELGLPIVHEEHRPGDIEALKTVTLHADYQAIDSKELAISHGYLVSRKGK
ncbi:MAG: class I SAM-dependent methyltransferase [Bacteroidota bacterium]